MADVPHESHDVDLSFMPAVEFVPTNPPHGDWADQVVRLLQRAGDGVGVDALNHQIIDIEDAFGEGVLELGMAHIATTLWCTFVLPHANHDLDCECKPEYVAEALKHSMRSHHGTPTTAGADTLRRLCVVCGGAGTIEADAEGGREDCGSCNGDGWVTA